MDILFYKLQDEINDVKKTRTLTAVEGVYPLTVTGYLRGSASKVAPTIEFSKDVTYFNDYNYCYIPDFKRYYFVDNPVSIRTGYCSLDFRVDVLTSFLTQPDAQYLDCFVTRSSRTGVYNPMIPDKMVQFSTEPEVTVSEPTSTDYPNAENVTFKSNATFNTVITMAVDTGTHGKNWLNLMNDTLTIPTDLQTLFGSSSINTQQLRPNGVMFTYVTDYTYHKDSDPNYPYGDLVYFLAQALTSDTIASAIYSVKVYPFSIPHSVGYCPVYALGETLQDGRNIVETGYINGTLCMHIADNCNSGYKVLKDFTLTYPSGYNEGIFSMYEPYSRCEIFLPFSGWYSLNIKENLNCRLLVCYNVDYVSGLATVFIYNKTKNMIVYETQCQLGIDVDYSTSNMKENMLRESNNITNYATGLISAVAMTAVGIASTPVNPVLAVGGVIAGLGATASFITNENILLDKTSTHITIPSASTGMFTGFKVLVKWSKLKPLNFFSTEKTDFIEHFGCPVNEVKLFSNLRDTNDYHNYAEISELHLSRKVGSTIYKITDITFSEAEELKKLCSEGIYV